MRNEKLIEKTAEPFNEGRFDANYGIKVSELMENHKIKREFSNNELAYNACSYSLAKKNLTEEEYQTLLKVREFYSGDKTFKFNYKSWKGHISVIMASYDLVAPLYKFGNVKENLALEKEKSCFRERAKEIIANDELGSIKWIELLQEFKNEFGKSYAFAKNT